MSRTRRSARNAIAALAVNSIALAAGFITQRMLMSTLGPEVVGLNALYLNIVAFLSLAELGIGTAIIYQLYAPVAAGDWDRVRSFLSLYRKWYIRISGTVALAAVALLPVLPLIGADGAEVGLEGRLVLGLFVADVIASYVFAYRRSVLIATELNYVVSVGHAAYLTVMLVAQVSVLETTQSYYGFLAVKFACRILEGLYLEAVARNRVPEVRSLRGAFKLSESEMAETVRSVKALILHKIGSYAVLGTDFILISAFLGLREVGIFSNYVLIQSALATVVTQVFAALVSSVGNLLATAPKHSWRNVYRRIERLNFWIAVLAAGSLAASATALVAVWVGPEFALGRDVVLLMAVNLFLSLTRSPLGIFKDAAGIFHQDRHIPILEAVLNLALGLLLIKLVGLPGVLLATLGSSLLLHLYSLPRFVFVQHLGGRYSAYLKNLGLRAAQFGAVLALISLYSSLVPKYPAWPDLFFSVGAATASVALVFWASRALGVESPGLVKTSVRQVVL